MTVKKVEVKVFREVLICDDCEGEMLPTGAEKLSYPPLYPHECEDCSKRKDISDKIYPRVVYENK